MGEARTGRSWVSGLLACASAAALARCAPADSLAFQLPDAAPRCTESADAVSCAHVTVTLRGRSVHLMHPAGAAPAAGFAVAVLFQGSFHPAEVFWSARMSDAYGGYHQTRLVRALLDAGFAVITPDAAYGAAFWQTNVVPYAQSWEISDDRALMDALLEAIAGGRLGPLDATRLYASGISSGGYMTSRMALAYPGRFRALAIASASFASCSGALCSVGALPADHPPTLFLHGAQDAVVPIATMRAYDDALRAAGRVSRVVVDDTAGHEWLAVSPDEVVAWFRAH